MVIDLYNLNKRPNSTKRPAVGDTTKLEISNAQLKEDTSVISPTILLSPKINNITLGPGGYNYMYIPAWNRYYFISDWRYVGGIWEIDCTVDVLASFKTEIGNTSAYVLRASGASNGDIIDQLYPTKTNMQLTKVNVSNSWYGVAPSGGCYIIGVINNTIQSRVGAVCYYALSASEMTDLLDYLFSGSIYYDGVAEISETLFKSMFNPFQYMVSCMWFPYPSSTFGSTTVPIYYGYWDTGLTGVYMTALTQKTYVTATIPNHPQIARGAYLNRAPYTRLNLYIPPFGSIPIDTSVFSAGNYLYSAVLIDHVTGQATIRISTCPDNNHLNEYNIVTERTALLGVPIQLAQITTDYLNTTNAIGGGIAGFLSAIGSGQNFFDALGNIGNSVNNAVNQVSTSGANGSFANFMLEPSLLVEHYLLVDENLTEYGRPLCEQKTISTLSGYIKTGEDDHSFKCLDGEREQINDFMKNGFFYE